MKKYTCPCCGYKTLDNEHEYSICPICYWEDDYFQFEDVDLQGGANNGTSLRQAQKNYIEFGVCDKKMLKHVRQPNKNDVKDEKWTPLLSRMKYQCPCCEFYTYPIAPKEDVGYICPVCFWENDAFLNSDAEPSCCNHGITLQQAKKNFEKFKACEYDMIPNVRPPKEDEIKENA